MIVIVQLKEVSARIKLVVVMSAMAIFAGCQATAFQTAPPPAYTQFKSSVVSPLDLKALPETISFEHTDRVNRLARLSRQFGAQAPDNISLAFTSRYL